MKKLICAALVVGLFEVAANSQTLVNDDFNRADGSLVGTVPTPGPGGAWVNHSGTVGDLLITGGQAFVKHGAPSEDANVPFAIQTAGLLTATFDINVSATGVITGGDYEYFAHFSDGGTSAFFSRLDIVPAAGAGDYTLGLATAAGAAEIVFPTDFNFGDSVNVALTYDFGSGLSSLTVGATTVFSTSSVLSPGLSAFALRQSDSSLNEGILVDNLVVSIVNVPEPTTAVLGGMGLLALIAARRRN